VSPSTPRSRPRLVVHDSPVHGRGVSLNAPIAAGEVIATFAGEVIDEAQADRRAARRAAGHTWMFDIGDGLLLDGGRGGNATRFINHSCEPNCAAETDGQSVTIAALRDITAGEELFLDYQLTVDGPLTRKERALYTCRCGAPTCRGTMLAD